MWLGGKIILLFGNEKKKGVLLYSTQQQKGIGVE